MVRPIEKNGHSGVGVPRLPNTPERFPDWSGETVVCIASGPSLTLKQVEIARQAQRAGRCRVIVVNDNYRIANFADVLYACDERWWDLHFAAIHASQFRGQLWTCNRLAHRKYGITHIHARNAAGLSMWPGVLHHGTNSGYQAIGLAHQFGAARVLLLGYDMQQTDGKTHWFGEHPSGLNNAQGIAKWAKQFVALAEQLTIAGVEVINCTAQSALRCFPRRSIEEVLPPDEHANDPPI